MAQNKQNWAQIIKDARIKYGTEKIVRTFMGLMHYWEFQMLKDLNAITEEGIVANFHIVRDKKDNILYMGKSYLSAKAAKDSSPGATMTEGIDQYVHYMEFKKTLNS